MGKKGGGKREGVGGNREGIGKGEMGKWKGVRACAQNQSTRRVFNKISKQNILI